MSSTIPNQPADAPKPVHMLLECDLRPTDVIKGHWLNLRPRMLYVVLGCCLLLLFAFSVYLSIFSSHQNNYQPHPFRGLILLVCLVFIVGVLCIEPLLIVRVQHLLPTLNRSVEIDEDGIAFAIGTNKKKIPWSDVSMWKCNSEIVLLYQGWTYHKVIPRRAFRTEDEFETFKTLLAKKGIRKV